jgi:hypothetical protein
MRAQERSTSFAGKMFIVLRQSDNKSTIICLARGTIRPILRPETDMEKAGCSHFRTKDHPFRSKAIHSRQFLNDATRRSEIMKNFRVKDLMVPLSEYATVDEDATLYEAVVALEKAQEEYCNRPSGHSDSK